MEESEKEKIRQEARRILDGFASSLEKVKLKAKETKRARAVLERKGREICVTRNLGLLFLEMLQTKREIL